MKTSSIVQLIALALAIIVLVPQLKEFSSSREYVTGADAGWVGIAVLCMFATILFAALVYIILVPKKLPFFRTAVIQLATYFTNRLLPSGLGGIGFNALYLVKQAGLSRTDGAVFATANNLIGFVAFSICIALSTLATDSKIETELPIRTILLVVAGLVIIGALLSLTIKRVQKRLIDFIGHLFGVILEMIKHPKRIVLATIASMGITASYAAVLWATTKSVGIELSLVDLFIAFVAGNTALTISPTPGGIGAVEAAITSVIISANVEPSIALAGVVIFRLVSYWFPIIPGYLAFRYALKQKYV
jgi:glycosyltransferase 2 family protein